MTPPDPQALEQAVEIALERIMKAMWSKDRVFKEQVSQEMDEWPLWDVISRQQRYHVGTVLGDLNKDLM